MQKYLSYSESAFSFLFVFFFSSGCEKNWASGLSMLFCCYYMCKSEHTEIPRVWFMGVVVGVIISTS